MPLRARLLLASFALIVVAHGDAAARDPWVIPPGQESIVGQMLGGVLPGNCHLQGASLSRTFIAARFDCDGATSLALELHHTSDDAGAAFHTGQFAVVVRSGQAPSNFLAALEAQLRTRESAWHWQPPARDLVEHSPGEGQHGSDGSDSAAGANPVRAHETALKGAGALVGGGFILFLFVLALGARRPHWFKEDTVPHKAPYRVRVAVEAILIWVVSYALLSSTVAPPPLHSDTLRDLWMALDCLHGGACNQGPPSSFFALEQGALWIRILAATRWMGLHIATLQHVLFALQSLATAIVYLLCVRLHRALGLPSALFFWVLSTQVAGYPLLWNPSLAPLPVALFYYHWRQLIERGPDDDYGGLRASAWIGLWLALSVESHLVCVLLTPLFVIGVLANARRPFVALLIASGVCLITLFALSGRAWTDNLHSLHVLGPMVWLASSGLVLLAIAAVILRRALAFMDGPARARLFFVAAATLAPAILWISLGKAGGIQYLAPFAVIAAVVPGGLLLVAARPLRQLAPWLMTWRLPSLLAVLAGVAAVIWQVRYIQGGATDYGWRFPEVETVARRLYAPGVPYRNVKPRVRSPAPFFARGLMPFEPRPRPVPLNPFGDDILVLRLSRSQLPAAVPPNWRIVDLGGNQVALIRPIKSVIDYQHVLACRRAKAEQPDCTLAREDDLDPEAQHPEGGYPEPYDPCPEFKGEAGFPFVVTYELQLDSPPAPGRWFGLLGDSGWTIAEVKGANARRDAKGGVVVEPGAAEPARMVLTRQFADSMDWIKRCAPPPIAELSADETQLRALLESGAARF